VKKLLFAIVTLFASVCHLASGQAALIYTLDVDSTTPGIQSTRSVVSGSSFTVDLLMNVTNPTVLAGYNLTTQFSTSNLSLTNRVDTTPAVATWQRSDSATPLVNGQIRRINATSLFAAFPENITSFSGPIASFTFTATGAGTSAITPGIFESGIDDFLDSGFASITPTFNPGSITVTAVPEPGSIALLTVSAVAAVFARRRWSRTRSK
jgi:hypothetical protein